MSFARIIRIIYMVDSWYTKNTLYAWRSALLSLSTPLRDDTLTQLHTQNRIVEVGCTKSIPNPFCAVICTYKSNFDPFHVFSPKHRGMILKPLSELQPVPGTQTIWFCRPREIPL